MSLQTYVSSFTIPTGVGSFDVTGFGFDPVGVYLYTVSGGFGNYHAIGFDDGTHHNGHVTGSDDLSGAYDNVHQAWSDVRSLLGVWNGGFNNFRLSGYLTMIPGGFRVTIDFHAFNSFTGLKWNFMAFGGSGIQFTTRDYDDRTSPGDLPVTGTGFPPIALLTKRHPGVRGTQQAIGYNGPTFGFGCDCGLGQGSAVSWVDPLKKPSNTKSYQRSDKYLTKYQGGAVLTEATIQAMQADGFLLNYTLAQSGGGVSLYQTYAALGGLLSANIVAFTQPAAPGVQTIPVLMQQPLAFLVMSTNKPASGLPVDDAFLSLGAGNIAAQIGVWAGDADNHNFAWVHKREDLTHLILSAVPTAHNASTITGRAALTAFPAYAIELTWDISDGVPREWIGLVLGEPGTGSLASCGGVAPDITGMTCQTGQIILTGTNFPPSPIITLTDPNGDPFPFTIVSATTTQIVLQVTFVLNGTYCATILGITFCAVLSCATPPAPEGCILDLGVVAVGADPAGCVEAGVAAVSGPATGCVGEVD